MKINLTDIAIIILAGILCVKWATAWPLLLLFLVV